MTQPTAMKKTQLPGHVLSKDSMIFKQGLKALFSLLFIAHIHLKAGQPNFIFILSDDQGWNGLSVQMHPELPDSKSDFYRTPNLEKLAADGMRFSHAYAPGPMCSPTRGSIQTGKSPAQTGLTNVGGGRQQAAPWQRLISPPYTSSLSTDEVTIGETLKTAGYATAWFGKWHLGGEGPGAHGYDESDGPTGNNDGNTRDPQNPKDIFGVTKRGLSFMEKNVEAGKPFYLQLWHYAVHGPTQTKPETEQAYAARRPGQRHQSNAFAGMTENLDTGVGMILDKVKELSIEDNTYIIYMSDHGASQGVSTNAPLNRGKGSLWEGGMRVPFMIRGPGVSKGLFCSTPIVGWDLFPTFCDLAGVKQLPKGLEGVSLKPLFQTGRGTIRRPGNFIAFHYPHYREDSPVSTITMNGYKLIKFYESNTLRLFNLNQDIGEQHDLATRYPDKAADLHRRLNTYLASINAKMPSVNPNFDPNAVASTQRRGGPRGGGRRGPRQAQIEARQKELALLQEAVTGKDRGKIGQVISTMKQSLENAPPSRRPGVSEARQQELKQLEAAYQQADYTKLSDLIAQIKERLANGPPRGAGGPQRGGGRRPGQRPGQRAR